MERVMDRADDEGPGEPRPSTALRLDDVAENARAVGFHFPAVPARKAVRPCDPETTGAALLVSKWLVAEKADAVRQQLRPDPMRPHSTRVVHECPHLLR
jgi:hypothetical protein